MPHQSAEIWQKRLKTLQFIVLLLFSIVALRVFQKSVIEHQKYLKLGEKQYLTEQLVTAKRGEIYAQDKDGLVPLAINLQKYQILVVPKNTPNKEEISQKLAEILGMDKKEIYEKINNNKTYVPPIARRVEKDKADKIKEANFKDVRVLPDYARFYPEHELASHILGFVNFDNKGNYGVEQYYDSILSGIAGSLLAEKDNLGRFINILSEYSPAKNGDSLVLTIERNVQYRVEQILKEAVETTGAEDGQVIVVEPKTGKILAMASFPNFDPNTFNQIAKEKGEEAQKIFTDPIISFGYEPGSILKPIIASIGIDVEKFQPDTKAGPFSNMVVVQGYEIHTALDKGYGEETITQILENSDNVGMVWVAEQIGNDELYKGLKNYNLAEKTGIDLPGEIAGTLLPLKNWRDIHRATLSFGQGILITPLQLAQVYSTIANNGELVKLHLVDKIIRSNGKEEAIEPSVVKRVIKTETAQKVRQMLLSVIENGQSKKAKIDGYQIGGKTGTAQIAKADGSGYEEEISNHSYGGMAPINDPRFVVVVRLEKPSSAKFADSTALPAFRKIMQYLLNYYQIPKS